MRGVQVRASELEGLGMLEVDTAYGGGTFVIVDAAALGFEIAPHEAQTGWVGADGPVAVLYYACHSR